MGRLNEAFTGFESEIIELKKKLEYSESSKENNVCDKNDSKYRSDELRRENRKLHEQIEDLQDTENDLRKKKMEFMREIDSLKDTVRKLETSNSNTKNQNENADTERKIKMLAATVESLTSEKKSFMIEQNKKIIQQEQLVSIFIL